MGIFAAIDEVAGHQFALTVQHRQIMGYRHQVHFRRQQGIIGVIPPMGGEDAQLPTFNQRFDFSLDRFEIGGGRTGKLLGIGIGVEVERTAEAQVIFCQDRIL